MISNHSLIFNTIIIQNITQRKIIFILAVNKVVVQLSTKICNFVDTRSHPLSLFSPLPLVIGIGKVVNERGHWDRRYMENHWIYIKFTPCFRLWIQSPSMSVTFLIIPIQWDSPLLLKNVLFLLYNIISILNI